MTIGLIAAAAAVALATSSNPGDPAASPAAPIAVAAPAALATPPGSRRLAEASVVEIEIMDSLSSRRQRPGDGFDIQLAKAIMIDGVVVVPAGAAGRGEVVDAGHSQFGGKPGKLVLAARFIELPGIRVPLRGLKLSGGGEDRTSTAMVVSMLVGIPGIFVQGGEIEIPAGTRAYAKVAADVILPPIATAAASTVAATPSNQGMPQ